MGTELMRRGLPTPLPAWSSQALIDDPGAVLGIHRDHVRAGADLLTADTFRTTRRALSRVGLGDRAAELTALAVRLAHQAASDQEGDRRVHVLGSMAPLEDCYHPELVPEAGALATEHAEHAGALASAGVDALLVETMNTHREALAAVRAARATGLPVLASFVANARGHLFNDEPLAELVRSLIGEGVAAILVNCTPIATTDRVVPLLRDLAGSTPIGVYANIGFPHPREGWEVTDEISPAAYAKHAMEWMQAGARILGGCCGTTPDHIAALREMASAVNPPADTDPGPARRG
jgi:S-methylmethionine-dependent homocysteine/selenocysteine methylase